jgi:hypothetical protein
MVVSAARMVARASPVLGGVFDVGVSRPQAGPVGSAHPTRCNGVVEERPGREQGLLRICFGLVAATNPGQIKGIDS